MVLPLFYHNKSGQYFKKGNRFRSNISEISAFFKRMLKSDNVHIVLLPFFTKINKKEVRMIPGSLLVRIDF